MKNKALEKLKNGEKLIGTFFPHFDPDAVECLGMTGLDFVILDTEHGPGGVMETMSMIRAAELQGLTPFVRIKDTSRESILKLLDVGAQALVIPNISSVQEAREVVEYAKYFPLGKRGVAYARTAGWGFSDEASGMSVREYFEFANKNTMVILQCETVECLESIEEIVGTDGVDGIFVGPFDLSTSLGIPKEFDSPVFTAALERILSACRAAGKPCHVFCPDNATARLRLSQGFDSVAVNTDLAVYVQAFRSLVREVLDK